jgi:predicted esterase
MAMRGFFFRGSGLAFAALVAARASLRAAEGEAKIVSRTLVSAGKPRTDVLYVPEGLPADRPAPLVLTLHGSGRNGRSLVSGWQDLARKEGIVLAGPDATDSQHWSAPADGPALLRDVVEDVRAIRQIDPRRMCAAVHAGALQPSQYSISNYARRKIPIQIAIGDRDEFFVMADARATVEALKAAGFPAEIVEMRFHNHDYSSSAGKINRTAWEFLSRATLPADPRYAEYRAR